MSRSWWWKSLFTLFTVILAAVYVYPTAANLDPETTKFPFKQKVNLGLDLQGGLYMVLGVDFNKVFREVANRQAGSLEGRLKEKGIAYTSAKVVTEGFPADDARIVLEFPPASHDAILKLLKDEHFALRTTGDTDNRLELGLSHEYKTDVRDRTIGQSIEVIRNRIDEFGVSEPAITSQGLDRVVVELPGVKEIDRAKDLIGRTAKLEFKIVDDKSMNPNQVAALVQEIEKTHNVAYKEGEKFSDYAQKINELIKPKIPAGDEIGFERLQGPGGEVHWQPYLLISKADVTGEDLQDAQVGFDPQTNRPEVDFQMNPKGAAATAKLTGANVGKRMAIVLDNIVHSAPVIQSEIGARGRITVGGASSGTDPMKEAKDLAIVLRAGALPAQLDFLEQRIVGPSLGADSVHKGATASLVGALLVFIFVAIYYRVSGVIAVISLLINVLFVVACLVGLEATLTLPGIAGIALTVGIAVDSNVVIYERIREELRHGKSPFSAVDAGFQKAFRTILDANITNAAAAVILLLYGTGPIKGFAVTMLIGIITTLYSAVFVCRIMFDAYLRRLESTGSRVLSI